MLQCSCCGRWCREASPFWQSRGEYFGSPAWEELLGCPFCGGSLELRDREDFWEDDWDDRSALEK